jgi:type II secretory pathway component PulF
MPRYLYKAVNEKGDIFKGSITAFDEKDVEQRLQDKGLTFISGKLSRGSRLPGLIGGTNVKPRMVMEFYYRLAQASNLGLPILSSLDDDSMLIPSKPLKKIIQETKVALESGKTFFEAMSRFPKVFEKLDLSIIRMGEETGKLPKCLNDLATFLEWKEETRSAIKRATIYPLFTMLIILAVIGVWVGYVLPQMASVLTEMDISLPKVTKVILAVSLFLHTYWGYILGLVFLVFVSLFIFRKTRRGGIIFHEYLLKLPILGDLMANVAYARLSHHFATMHEAGMNIKGIFDILQDNALGNRYLEERLKLAYGFIQQGKPIAESFESAGGFPSLLLGAIKNGEKTGTLSSSFNRLGDYYDREVKRSVQVLVNSFEPLTIIILGGVFGLIILSIMLPLYDVIGQIAKAY